MEPEKGGLVDCLLSWGGGFYRVAYWIRAIFSGFTVQGFSLRNLGSIGVRHFLLGFRALLLDSECATLG